MASLTWSRSGTSQAGITDRRVRFEIPTRVASNRSRPVDPGWKVKVALAECGYSVIGRNLVLSRDRVSFFDGVPNAAPVAPWTFSTVTMETWTFSIVMLEFSTRGLKLVQPPPALCSTLSLANTHFICTHGLFLCSRNGLMQPLPIFSILQLRWKSYPPTLALLKGSVGE